MNYVVKMFAGGKIFLLLVILKMLVKLPLLVILMLQSLESMSSSDLFETDLPQTDYDLTDLRFDQKIDELHQWAEVLIENLNTQYS
jgi:hypothetical protein